MSGSDSFFIIGLLSMAYGQSTLQPWFTAVGVILMAIFVLAVLGDN